MAQIKKTQVILTVLVAVFSRLASSEQDGTMENYCPYFENRAPKPQPDLQNCTWYRENSCCLSKELTIIMENIPPPTGANAKCLKMLNYLMCYVCAPNQNEFYQNERLTVCQAFCDQLFDACGDAYLKGSKIRDFYLSGVDFCLSRKFKVSTDETRCYLPYKGDGSFTTRLTKNTLLTVVMMVIARSLC